MEPRISIQCKFADQDKIWKKDISLKDNPNHIYNIDVKPLKLELLYSILIQWNEPQTRKNRCGVLENMLSDKTLADCCILAANDTEIKCHRNVLAANSDVFKTMLTSGLKESQTKRIEMTDLSKEVVNEMLSYLHGVEINISHMKDDIAFLLLSVAHKYNIVSLEEDMLNTLLLRNDKDFDIDLILAMYYFTVNIEQFQKLCEKTVNILRRNPKALISSSSYQELLKRDPQEAAKLPWKLLELGSEYA